jgi:hypothetical protein
MNRQDVKLSDERAAQTDEQPVYDIKYFTSKITAMMKRMMEIVRNSLLMYLKFTGDMDAV